MNSLSICDNLQNLAILKRSRTQGLINGTTEDVCRDRLFRERLVRDLNRCIENLGDSKLSRCHKQLMSNVYKFDFPQRQLQKRSKKIPLNINVHSSQTSGKEFVLHQSIVYVQRLSIPRKCPAHGWTLASVPENGTLRQRQSVSVKQVLQLDTGRRLGRGSRCRHQSAHSYELISTSTSTRLL